MPEHHWPRRVLLTQFSVERGSDFDESIAAGLETHECEVVRQHWSQEWCGPVDLVMGYGPFSIHAGLGHTVRKLQQFPFDERPTFVWWLTENTPDPRLPGWLVHAGSSLRMAADSRLFPGPPWLPDKLKHQLLRGHRLRVFGQLSQARRLGLLDLLAVTCPSRSVYYGRYGFETLLAPLGYHPVYGIDLRLDRDIPVAFIGSVDSPRRQKLLGSLTDALGKRGVQVQTETSLYGEERTRFLNRTRIILNVLRARQDFVGQRFLLAAANKALVVSEPILDIEPFVPGKHLVVTPPGKMLEAVMYYLENEAERRSIAEEAYEFVRNELTIARMIGRILEAVRDKRRKGFQHASARSRFAR
jgi:hypothetical protein